MFGWKDDTKSDVNFRGNYQNKLFPKDLRFLLKYFLIDEANNSFIHSCYHEYVPHKPGHQLLLSPIIYISFSVSSSSSL